MLDCLEVTEEGDRNYSSLKQICFVAASQEAYKKGHEHNSKTGKSLCVFFKEICKQ